LPAIKSINAIAWPTPSPLQENFGIVRYNSDGTVDGTFGTSGFARIDVGGDDVPTSMVVLPDNSIVMAGYTINGGNKTVALVKLNSSGAPVVAFDGDGIRNAALGFESYAYSIIRQSGGGLVIAGYGKSLSTSTYDFLIARYNETTGALDASFNTVGFAFTPVGAADDIAYAVKQQADGRFLVAGSSEAAGFNKVFAVARYNTNGSLHNPGFGTGGIVTINFNSLEDVAYGIEIMPLYGSIFIGGYSYNGSNYDFAIARLNTNGTFDNTFDGDGRRVLNVGSNSDPSLATNDRAQDIIVQIDGKLLIGGYVDPNPDPSSTLDDDYAVVRLDTLGADDITFGPNSNGRNVIIQSGDDRAYTLALQNSKILIGGVSGASLSMARLNNIPPFPLPVNLLSFTASRQNSAVQLQWRTSVEYRAVRFEIERSRDGNTYTKIGEVDATGNSSATLTYGFTDAQPFAGLNQYRLRIVNDDGSIQYSRVALIRFDNKVSIQAYPNPVKSVLNVQVKADAGMVRLQVIDASGRVVKQLQAISVGGVMSVPVDMSSLPAGWYLLQVNEETIRVIKE
jgi:uncharacterized delta-60 repeat protein